MNGSGPSAWEGEIVLIQVGQLTRLATDMLIPAQVQKDSQTPKAGKISNASASAGTPRSPHNQDTLHGDQKYAYTVQLLDIQPDRDDPNED